MPQDKENNSIYFNQYQLKTWMYEYPQSHACCRNILFSHLERCSSSLWQVLIKDFLIQTNLHRNQLAEMTFSDCMCWWQEITTGNRKCTTIKLNFRQGAIIEQQCQQRRLLWHQHTYGFVSYSYLLVPVIKQWLPKIKMFLTCFSFFFSSTKIVGQKWCHGHNTTAIPEVSFNLVPP